MKKKQKQKPQTLCWSCANEAFTKCPWVLFGQAVKGWKAEKTEIKNGALQELDRVTPSYMVKKCPNYIKEVRKKITRIKTCPTCGQEFVANKKTKMYCSKSCKENREHTCLYCGKALKGCKRYCDNKCYYRYNKKLKRKESDNVKK